jgi:mono/diheme cytochrome c family protein
MKLSLQLNGLVLVAISSFAMLPIVFAVGKMFQSVADASAAIGDGLVIPPEGTLAHQGYGLFMRNCAHCHGTDARGDEGPDLHGVTKSDQRIARIIQNGIKGEMPKFGAKLNDADTQALIAFLRTLKEN